MLTASMVQAAVQGKGEKEQGRRVSPKGIATPAQTSCFPCTHMHSISKCQTEQVQHQITALNHSKTWQTPCAAAPSALSQAGKAIEEWSCALAKYLPSAAHRESEEALLSLKRNPSSQAWF
eukprot:1161020-Pelagomonas_calceolata.AAC.2